MFQSKYYEKTHEEITYDLDEYQCPYCKHWFMIDIGFCADSPTDDYDDYKKIFCSYCGKFHRRAV